MADNKGSPWLARLFWLIACGNLLLVLPPALRELNSPSGEFSGLAAASLLLIALCVGVVAAVVAVIRRPVAYGIGLALVCIPALWFGSLGVRLVADRLAAPGMEDQATGGGYFTAPADRALAEAIVAGDAANVAALAPAAQLNATGWGGMTFMRLALRDGHPDRAVLAALLHAGIDPDQDSSALYGLIFNNKDESLLRLVIDSGVDLNAHMGRGRWFLFVRYDWPEGLALVLDHGAGTEAQDAMGYMPIMRAAQIQSWPTVETLLAHGARTDHVGNDGRTLRDLLRDAAASGDAMPPRITALRASLE